MNDERISVLYFTNALARGGVEEHILTLLRGLDREHFRLGLVCAPQVADKLAPDLPKDVALVPLDFRKPTQLTAAYRLARLLRELRVDILHSHQFRSSLCASPIGRLCGVPVIIETPHLREHWRQGWLKSSFFVDRAVGHAVDYYIAVSQANARYLAAQKGLPAAKIIVIRNGVDLEVFNPERPVPPRLREKLGFAQADPVLAVIGRLEPQKGHRVLLEALPAIQQEFPGLRVVCLGEGSLRAELESQARTLGLTDSVRFVGQQRNVAEWFALADVTVLPSFFEGLPLVAVESLASGRPVVATAVDGTPEVVVDGKTGLTVPPGDARALAGSICTVLRDQEFHRQLGRAGRKWVEQHFDQRAQIRQTQELYLRAWHERRPATSSALISFSRENRAGLEQPEAAHEYGRQLLTSVICQETIDQCRETYGEALRGIVLTGSLARQEGTFGAAEHGWRLLGDAEFLLIFQDRAPLPASPAVQAARREIEERLRRRGLHACISLAAAHANYLQRMKPHIFGYELRVCGRVVSGDPRLLSLIPEFSVVDIPREDAWRLLCNRMIEMLEVISQSGLELTQLPTEMFYRTVKLYLDMATSLLVFVGAYSPTYQERARQINSLAESPGVGGQFPFDIQRFARRVSACTEWKLSAPSAGHSAIAGDNGEGLGFWEDAILFAHDLWRWELARLTGAAVQASDRELLHRWRELQPAAQRLRGWLYVVRKQGWHRSWRDWPRWARQAWRASPRYWVYAAAGELFFRLPRLADQGAQANLDWQRVRSWLPVVPRIDNSPIEPWRRLAVDISRNYQQFLVETRS